MKKTHIIRDAILGGCLGTVLFGISKGILKLITQGFTQEIKKDILENICIFFIFAFWFAIFSMIYQKKFANKNQLLNQDQLLRKKEEKDTKTNKKSIVIYFSRADENYFNGKMKYIDKGNTEIVAEYIRDLTGADIFKVERKIPYSADYKTCLEESKKENNTGARPELVNYLDNIDDYEVIYIGGPVYLGILPAPMVTQLEKLNFEDKIVKPFTTHEGSGMGLVPNQLRKICVGAQMKYGLAIKGSEVNESKSKIEKWVNEK